MRPFLWHFLVNRSDFEWRTEEVVTEERKKKSQMKKSAVKRPHLNRLIGWFLDLGISNSEGPTSLGSVLQHISGTGHMDFLFWFLLALIRRTASFRYLRRLSGYQLLLSKCPCTAPYTTWHDFLWVFSLLLWLPGPVSFPFVSDSSPFRLLIAYLTQLSASL